MNKKLKILHLEDLNSDAELVGRMLEKSGIEFVRHNVVIKEDYERAINEFKPDIILSDHSLPSFDSIRALNILKEKKLNIPFILVTSTISEEFAVEIMKQGASDYILKDRLQRLPTAVINVMEKWHVEDAKNKAVSELQATHKKLKFHIENSPLGFIEWDKDGHIKSWSKQAEEIFGWKEKELKGNGKSGLINVDIENLPVLSEIALQLITGKARRNIIQHRNYTKDGRIIWCEWFNSALKDEAGNVITIMSLVQDITDRKHAEENLLQSETRLKEAQAIAHTGNWEIDLKQNKQEWSDELFNIYGIKKNEVKPSTELFLSFIHPDDKEIAEKEVQKVFETLIPASFNFRFIRKDGITRYGYAEARFEFEEDLTPIRLYGILQDITERKKAEEKLEKQNKELLKTNSELDRFVYSTSHDLRAPLSSILGLIQILHNDTPVDNTVQIERLYMIKQSILKLDNFIGEILNYSRNARLKVDFEEIDFKKLILEVKEALQYMDGVQGINLKVKIVKKVKFISDKRRVNIILSNLISNAIKYRDLLKKDSFVHVHIKTSNENVTISVEDNGIGIPDMDKEKIFEMFYRCSQQSTGSGLGLYIVKETLEILGGKIKIKSELKTGTKFTIEIPNQITFVN